MRFFADEICDDRRLFRYTLIFSGRHYELRSSYLPTFLSSLQDLNLLMNQMHETS